MIPDNLNAWIQSVGASLTVGALLGLLPPMAALIGIVVGIISIYESKTFQHWLANHRARKQARKLAKLRAKEKIVIAAVEASKK